MRLQQLRDGVRVWGSDIVVHSTNASFTGVGGNVLELQGLNLTPSLVATTALSKAKADYGRRR